jgi:glycosyltransferase involved in cell wall biosynthesis
VATKPQLLFVSTRFLFPVDSGGKIRTTQVLRGLKGGRFDITLVSPAPATARSLFAADIAGVCDRFVSWPEQARGLAFALKRIALLASKLPVPVATDRCAAGLAAVDGLLAERPDLVVIDFPHAAVLAPAAFGVPSVVFTHNVEAEIFARHARVATAAWRKWIWSNQHHKMLAFERRTLQRFDGVVAVAERDAEVFRRDFGITNVAVISTGVDLDFFAYQGPATNDTCVFIGSMDWLANVDGIEFFMAEVWPLIVRERPGARMLVVGRSPPQSLVERARGLNWHFTGFVDDVRPYVRDAAVSVIPLRIGGGTRLKAYEAMAMGCPVVSTAIGIEGLPVEDGVHYRRADTAADMAGRVIGMFTDRDAAAAQARDARAYVERNFSYRSVAREFEAICLEVIRRRAARA